jgi:hypothetical protein
MVLMSFVSIYELHVAPPRSRHKTVFLTEHMEELAVPMLIPGITLNPPADLLRDQADAAETVRRCALGPARGVISEEITARKTARNSQHNSGFLSLCGVENETFRG